MKKIKSVKKKMRVIFHKSVNQKSFYAALAVGLALTLFAILFLPL
jgi:hypothetical protein